MPPRETNKVSAGRAKVKDTAKSNPVASTASRASAGARATRSVPRKLLLLVLPLAALRLVVQELKGALNPQSLCFLFKAEK